MTETSDFLGTGSIVFHHVGLISADIERESGELASLGYQLEGEPFVDPLQGVRGLFLARQSPRLELLSPLVEEGVLGPWMRSKNKLYHLAYQASDLSGNIGALRQAGAKVVVNPVPAVAFQGRLIAFVMLPSMLLVELIGPS
jgi:methylmalonyl-CoA/ethylmalonyl-CoA epimerase